MLKLIPNVKRIEYSNSYVNCKGILPFDYKINSKLSNQINKLPIDSSGVSLVISHDNGCLEGYDLEIQIDKIVIKAKGEKGVFYAIQTLRQIFDQAKGEIPCVKIHDEPSFLHRGFYHDITRGKIPTIDTLKELIDTLAYYKYNSLQLYVEHVFEFNETTEIVERTGVITKEELKELDEYCKQNFIDFIPSLSTFGHMYEILEQDKYKHLNVLTKYKPTPNRWAERQMHHTIDPRKEESFELVKSLIDQYSKCFSSEYFNICCDETFDLKKECGENEKELYVQFVKKIISFVRSKGKKVMMWADILLSYPEVINQIPEDVIFLNWDYRPSPEIENVEKLKNLGKDQIVCPGTWSWNNFCENILDSEPNICKMAEYGYLNKASGMIVTNWGDYNNICSLELAHFGMVLGAEKSWNPTAEIGNDFYDCVDTVLYKSIGASELLKKLVNIQSGLSWADLCYAYSYYKDGLSFDERAKVPNEVAKDKLAKCQQLIDETEKQSWVIEKYKKQFIIAIKSIMLIIIFNNKLFGEKIDAPFNVEKWLEEYCADWLKKNKPSELYRIQEMVEYLKKI